MMMMMMMENPQSFRKFRDWTELRWSKKIITI